MACCKSMLARRIVLWYILLGTFVIFPISLNVGMGCRFLNVGVDNGFGFQSFGPFNVAIYDPEARGKAQFLGCVDLSVFWEEETSNDFGFTALRISSALLLGFVSLATLICVCLQCFAKHGKSHWWDLMRFCYVGATLSQGAMYTVYASDMCGSGDEDSDAKCTPGTTGIIGAFNFLLLFLMVFATFSSLPPRNPVFQCWTGDMDYDDDYSDDGSTSEEDSVMRKFKALGDEDHGDGVSLFSGSRVSRKSRRSMKSGKDEDDSLSAAEKGVDEGSRNSQSSSKRQNRGSVASTKSGKSKASEILVETVESESVSTAKSSKSILPKMRTLVKKPVDEEENLSSKKSGATSVTKKTTEDKDSFKKSVQDLVSLASKKSNRSSKSTGTREDYGLKSMSSASGSTLEVTNFVIQLIEMTQLQKGGRRVKLADIDNQVEIVDEYPTEEEGEIKSTPSTDEVTVRTEYYDLGSRTTKEIKHSDGSRTIVTTITVDNTSDSTTAGSKKAPMPLEPPVQLTHSAGSIVSYESSRYQVEKSDSSATSFVGTGKDKNLVTQGDLALSVATASVAQASLSKT